jgi:HD-like signal output (HDOD) protein
MLGFQYALCFILGHERNFMVELEQARVSSDVATWIAFFKTAEIPVLKQTARAIEAMREDEDNASTRKISATVLHDPVMVFKVLSYAQNHRGKNQLQDLLQVEQAILMMGTTTFFAKIQPAPIVEVFLKQDIASLMYLLKLIVRAHRASRFAAEFAANLMDLRSEEVCIAALLHDLSEMLMWCFDPEKMKVIAKRQEADKHLRSVTVQQDVLGFKLSDLQRALVDTFKLPLLLSQLMDDDASGLTRVKNVAIAVNLARHSAHGWDDAALPDDYKDVASLLHVDISRAKHIIDKLK